MGKTNKEWLPVKELGCYLKYTNDVLMTCRMLEDGSREDNPHKFIIEGDGASLRKNMGETVLAGAVCKLRDSE